MGRPRAGRRIAHYLAAIAWGAFLLYLGGRSNVPAVRSDLPLDKAAHFVLYGVLGALSAWGWVRTGRRPAWFWLIALGLLVGAADEVHQRTVPHRSSDVRDWFADAAGIGVGFAAAVHLLKKREGRTT